MMRSRSRRRNEYLPLLACFFFLICFLPLPAQHGSKNSKKELENKKKRINDEIRQLNSMISETKANKKSSIGALVKINIKLSKRQELINTINTELRDLENGISKNEAGISQLKSNLEKLKQEYARMLVFAQRHQDSYSILMFIFAAESFNQAYQRLKYMQQYSEFRHKQALEIINTQTALLAKLSELKGQRQEKNVLLGNEVVQEKILSGEKVQQEQVLTELQKKERTLKRSLEKKKEDAIQLQLAIKRLIEAEIKRKAEEAARAARARALAAKKAKEKKIREELARKKANAESKAKARPDVKKEEDTAEPAGTKKGDPDMPELSDEAVALSADFANNRGKLPWPVAKGVICEGYGEHEHPAIKGFMMFSNGLEICATKGMQARAVFEGEVTGIAVSPMGGNLVIIRHGEYLSVYSNIEDVLVKTGQKVSVKQPIGTVLYDEEEGKTSMNLQIWKGQKTMDPGGWLFGAR
jgi:septal ring factor EnvC (AmiA/AmiB activator)